jgi:FkbM family methyltransferase
VTIVDQWRTLRGVVRSLRIYYGRGARRADMDRLYRQFVGPGDLVFDVGAHVGDRIASFRRIGARVIAVEPQPALARTLRLLYGRDRAVTVESAAVGRQAGSIDRRSISTSDRVDGLTRSQADGARAGRVSVGQDCACAVITLDTLIERHGMPASSSSTSRFEVEALAGLTQPVPALSFEFTTIQRQLATAGIERCAALGFGLYNAALGESQALVHGAWQDERTIANWLAALPAEANSGEYMRFGPSHPF